MNIRTYLLRWTATSCLCGVIVSFAQGLPAMAQSSGENGPTIVYVAKDGQNIAPYDTPDKAATSLKAALAVVGGTTNAPGEVHIAAGVYSETEGKNIAGFSPMYEIEKPVRLVGTGASRDDVVLDAKNQCQVLLLNHPQAGASNLTLANGRFQGGDYGPKRRSSGNLLLKNGVVDNCVVSNGFGEFCGLAFVENGRVSNCDFTGGSMTAGGTDRPAAGLNVFGPAIVDHCRFFGNRGGYGAGLTSMTRTPLSAIASSSTTPT